ncbi:MAG: sigma 54-interacting transcriptional regulator [Desulfopila sp.]
MKIETVMQRLVVPMVITDCQGQVVFLNDEALALFKQAAGAGLPVVRLIPEIAEQLVRSLASGESFHALSICRDERDVLADILPVVDGGRVSEVVCILKENSMGPAREPDDSVRLPNRHIEAIFEGSSDGIWVCDGNGIILRINAASSKLNGVKPSEVIGRNVNDLLEKREFDQSVTVKVMASRRRETVMQYIARTKRFLLSTGTPSFDLSGRIDLVVINERDMTELNMLRKQVEEEQKVREKITEELSELALLELERNSIIAESDKMRQILQMALKLSNLGASNILILGESGTGKGWLAKLIHRNSKRRKMPFIEINCAALPEQLLEAELFGYEKGAFTGAGSKGKVGLFELANGGTLFLDEIGDMPLSLQAKLLKYLDSQEIRRVGGTETIKISCATIAATNQNLTNLVTQKRFREDLLYRLNSFTLELPPLRERREDISGLIRFYLAEFNGKYDCSKTVGPHCMRLLESYNFPGNIRELKNIVENGVVLSDTSHIDDFVRFGVGSAKPAGGGQVPLATAEGDTSLAGRLAEVEKQCLQQAQRQYRTTREIAAALGISQPSVVRKLKLYGLS